MADFAEVMHQGISNDYYSVSEEFFSKLPVDLRAPFEQIMKKGAEIISGCDKEIESLIRLIKVIPTTTSLSYIYRRLRTTKFEITTESMMEQEMLTTAFVVSYARLFAKSNGTCVLQRNDLPVHLRTVHDELYKIRNERYAHNGGHNPLQRPRRLTGFSAITFYNLSFAVDNYCRDRLDEQHAYNMACHHKTRIRVKRQCRKGH